MKEHSQSVGCHPVKIVNDFDDWGKTRRSQEAEKKKSCMGQVNRKFSLSTMKKLSSARERWANLFRN
jgi:hypothetical protein